MKTVCAARVVIACVAGTFTLAAEPDAKGAQAKSDFAISSRVETKVEVGVRDAVSADSHKSGMQVPGTRGTIVAGPVKAGGATCWQVDYDEGPDGWCSAGDLVDRTPPLPDFSLKGCFRDIQAIDLPKWFPTIVLDDLPENIEAQWKSRPYYRRSESRAESLKQATPTTGSSEVTTGGM